MILCRPIAVAPRPKGGWPNWGLFFTKVSSTTKGIITECSSILSSNSGKKESDSKSDPYFAMGYDFVALSHETGGHLAEETDEFFQQLVNHAGGGDPSDEARFRHYAATRLHLTNQIGVAKTILAHLPVTSTSRRRTRPLLGYVPVTWDI